VEVSGIKQGIPSWVELMTTDENAALAFYSGLFGWTDDAQPIPDGTVYHMQTLEGAAVAGLGAQQEQERQMGVPPHWNVYLAVDDLDEVSGRVEGAGGSLMLPPMDVMEIGRMAYVQDPTGGVVGLWQAKLHQGFGRIREPGTVTWCELITDDPAKAGEFYSKVLDVPTEAMPMQDQGPYTLLGPAKEQGAGIMQKTAEMGQMPNVWGVYFEVADTDATVAKAGELGGMVLSGPFDTMPGRIAMLADPQGAVFGVIKSNPMPM
jgi:predicted enzyme related to lactoylglutathione lyase